LVVWERRTRPGKFRRGPRPELLAVEPIARGSNFC
jgi:hypothetical protein